MKNKSNNHIFSLFVFLIILLLTIGISILCGGTKISLKETITSIIHPSYPNPSSIIIWKIRIPRIILGGMVGLGLAICGAAFQGMLRNPLADPFTLGISGGSAFGISIGILLGMGNKWISLCAFIGGLISTSLTYMLASYKRFSVSALILAGVILNFLFSSLVLIIFAIALPDQVHSTMLWLMGDLSSTSSDIVMIVSISIIIGFILLIIMGYELDALTLGEEKAFYLGINVEYARKVIFIIAAFIVGSCVAGAGIVGFIGLIIPHIVRKIVGPTHRILIFSSGICGASLLILCDALGRSIIAPIELPVGVITNILGSIFFIIFFLRTKEWEFF